MTAPSVDVVGYCASNFADSAYHVVMPALPGAHLILSPARLPFASFEDVSEVLVCYSLGAYESQSNPLPIEDVMIRQALHCPHGQGTNIIRHGKTRQGKQRDCCQEALGNGGTFLLDDTSPGHSVGVKQQIVDMAMNASGIRETARVLHISPTTVIKELKKRGCSR